MKSWLIFLKERFPLAVYLLLVGGFSTSGIFLRAADQPNDVNRFGIACAEIPGGCHFHWRALIVSMSGLLIFFAVLRIMDEIKDYEKDLIAHPDRPLPRGLLSVAQVKAAIRSLVSLMVAFGAALILLSNPIAGAIYLLITLYLWLMYNDFYTGGWLADRPALYGTTHQFILVLLCLFAVTVNKPNFIHDKMSWYFGFLILGSFFTYEICRKLDPEAHPILQTYLSTYKPRGTTALVLMTSAVALVFSYLMGLWMLLWPFEILVLLTLPLIHFKPEKYKVVEGATTLSLLVHLWAITIQHYVPALSSAA